MQVFIEGSRSSSHDWLCAQRVPVDELPALSPEQRKVAQQLGISAEAVARSVNARELSLPELARKAEAIGSFVESVLLEKDPEASVEEVTLSTLHGRVEMKAQVQGGCMYLSISEDLVDEMFQAGFDESERKIRRIIGLNLPSAVA